MPAKKATQKSASKLPYDPEAALAHLRAADPKLGALIDRVEDTGGFTLKLGRGGSPYTSLLQSILYQQLHGKAATPPRLRRLRQQDQSLQRPSRPRPRRHRPHTQTNPENVR